MFTRAVRRTLKVPGRYSGYRRWLRRLRSRSLAIVMYHGVTSEALPIPHWCQLPVEQFEQQMRFLACEYEVLPLAEAVKRLKRGAPLPERAACITFDDGFRNVYTTAYPILERNQLPAAVFLVTNLIDTRSPAWPELIYHAVVSTSRASVEFDGRTWPLTTAEQRNVAHTSLTAQLKKVGTQVREQRLTGLIEAFGASSPIEPDSPLATLNWTEIQELARGGLVTFGSHTHTHPILAQCSEETQATELRLSRDILLQHLGNADLFAYPNGTRGDFTPRTKRVLRELGYGCAVSTIPGLNGRMADVYELRRVNVGNDLQWSQFEMAMAGV